jgi:MoaA/NifB/PqqE/SkfB family radical SAM enzyme
MDDWEQAKNLFPLYVEISPAGACSHRCTFCAVSYIGFVPRLLDGRLMRERIREMGELGVKSVMFAGEGEPLLHREINATVLAAVGAGVDVAFTTNGVLLNKLEALDLVTWTKVSINAGTKETYAKVHRTKPQDWDRVWLNLASASHRKGACTLGVQIVVLPENRHEIMQLYARCVDAGVDYLVVKPYSQHKKSDHQIYADYKAAPEDFAHLEILDAPTKLYVRTESMKTYNEPQPYKTCYSTPSVWGYWMASGDFYSCSAYLMDDRFNLGNLNNMTFKEMWQGEKRRANWEFVRNHLDITECRSNCRFDKVNRYLWDLAQGVPHANFV